MDTSGDKAPHQPRPQRSRHMHRHDRAAEAAPATSRLKADRVVFLGCDQDGTLLEVMAVETDPGLLVIHAMQMREKYRPYLDPEEGEHDA
ncbi:MAG: hypothetical protein H0U61_14595 [Nocardioidaceae bacterium]|nr:hypothetical protein [Nocardioidaceae bacterium]